MMGIGGFSIMLGSLGKARANQCIRINLGWEVEHVSRQRKTLADTKVGIT